MKKVLVVGKLFPQVEKVIKNYDEDKTLVKLIKVKDVLQAKEKMQKMDGIILNLETELEEKENFIRNNEDFLQTIPLLACVCEELNVNYPQIRMCIVKDNENFQQIYNFLECLYEE